MSGAREQLGDQKTEFESRSYLKNQNKVEMK